jgi:UDP-glucuronate 4-epimerase
VKVLVTGNAGFIGFHVARALLKRGDEVVGFDSVNSYYDVNLKHARLALLEQEAAKGQYQFIRGKLEDKAAVNACFAAHRFDRVIHLAAQAGVRHSITNPEDYVASNLVGFTHMLEACRHQAVAHLTYASSSSVYGANATMPFSEEHGVDHPLHMYAATKRANELMAHAYSNLFALPTTGLRFFTVYGPWGRPDMALFLFTKNILAGLPIKVFNNGNHTRDFTYVADIVEGVIRASDDVAKPDAAWNALTPNTATSFSPYRVFNIGNSSPVNLSEYIETLEEALGKKSIRELLPLQAGDIPSTFADVSRLQTATGYKPNTTVREGIHAFVQWYREYYNAY